MNPENQPYRPSLSRVIKYATLTAFLCLNSMVFGQCAGEYQEVLEKDSTVQVPCQNMVLMNLTTFSSYYYARKNYDTLKSVLPNYRRMVDSIELVMARNVSDLRTVIYNQDEMIALEVESKEDALTELVKVTSAYRRERKKNKLLKVLLYGVGTGTGISLIF